MNNLVNLFISSSEIKRLNELKKYFSKNKDLDNKMKELKLIQKKLIRAKVNNDIILSSELDKKYKNIKEEIIDLPFVEEYFELLEVLHNDLEIVSEEIESSLNADFIL